jgi:hypothetical protein
MTDADPPGEAGPPGPDAPGPAAGLPGPGMAGSMPRAGRAWAEMLHRAEQAAAHRAEGVRIPAWLRRTPGEKRWPVTLTVIAAILLQILLPHRLVLRPIPPWLLRRPRRQHSRLSASAPPGR